jgi:iron(III) transport system permease protein
MKNAIKWKNLAIWLGIGGFLSLFLLLPLAKLIFSSFENWDTGFFDAIILRALCNTISTAAVATVLAVLFGWVLAYALCHANLPLKRVLTVIFIMPIFVPTITHGSGLIMLFGNNGLITHWLKLGSAIYGFYGIVLGLFLCSFSIAFLMFSNIFRYEDIRHYEAADVLGVGKWRQFTGLSLPYTLKSITSVACAVFALNLTDYGIPFIVGGKYKTLATIMYNEVIGLSDSKKGLMISIVFLAIALPIFVLELKSTSRGENQDAKHTSRPLIQNKAANWVFAIFLMLTALFILSYMGNFFRIAFTNYPYNLNISLDNFIRTLEAKGAVYWAHSLFISAGAALGGVIASFTIAYYTARLQPKAKIVHIISLLPASIPGLVLGLGYVIFFKNSPLYGGFAILILVNLIHFFAPAYLLAYNTLLKLNHNIEDVGKVFAIGRLKVVKDIIIPQTRPTLLEISTYLFVNSMITISAVSFLANSSNKPLALMIPQFENQQQLGNVAVVSLVIFLTNLIVRLVVGRIGKKISG